MREKDFQTRFNHWLKSVHKKTGIFELKLTKTNSLPFASVVPHQIDALWNAKHRVLVYKIPDVGFRNPADVFSLAGVPAYVVIKYSKGGIYLIDIDVFIKESETSKRRSLTEDRARVIATLIF